MRAANDLDLIDIVEILERTGGLRQRDFVDVDVHGGIGRGVRVVGDAAQRDILALTAIVVQRQAGDQKLDVLELLQAQAAEGCATDDVYRLRDVLDVLVALFGVDDDLFELAWGCRGVGRCHTKRQKQVCSF